MSLSSPRRPALVLACVAAVGASTAASASAAPAVTLDKSAALVAVGDTIVVTGSGFDTSPTSSPANAGLYVSLVGPDFDSSDPSAPNGGANFIPQASVIAGGGSLTTSLDVESAFGDGTDAVDCRQVQCVVRVWKAHIDADPSQRVTVPVSFAPTVTLDRSTDLVAAGDEITVTGSGFKASAPSSPGNAGLYLALVPADYATGSPTQGATFVPQAALVSSGGSFTTKLAVKSSFDSGGVDCLAVACAVRVWKAHTDADASQRVLLPVSFARPAAPPADDPSTRDPAPQTPAAPVVTPATPTPASTPAPAGIVVAPVKLALSRLDFTATHVAVTVSAPATVRATIAKRTVARVSRAGRTRSVVRWRTVRTVRKAAGVAGRLTLKATLAKGRYRVTVRATSPASVRSVAKTATLTVK